MNADAKSFQPPPSERVHPQVVGNGARRSRRFDVARSLALAEYSKFLGLLTPRRPEGRAPRSRQLADALQAKHQAANPQTPEKFQIANPKPRKQMPGQKAR